MDPLEDIHLDIDVNFEPQQRARSNTWPLRPTREIEPHNSPVTIDESPNETDQQGCGKDPLGLTAKKSGSRRNAWGNLSYADLITKAIQSSPEKRLTLSQIYDWMVQNVPYFKDKGDNTSSAGWKNSIRHNLSLHSRFMRIQNEGTGKSSWWVLNPDAKPGKTPRRRAGSMETKSYEKRRGRVRKKVEALRSAMENGDTLSPGGSDDLLDVLTFGGDFRPRASSNASSNGRLSPIQAGLEPDLHENQVPPMSPIPWETEVTGSPTMYSGVEYHDLVKSLVSGMKISNQDGLKMDITVMGDSYNPGSSRDFDNQSSNFMDINPNSSVRKNHYTHLPAPPPYPEQQSPQQINGLDFHTPNYGTPLQLQCTSSPVMNGSANFQQSDIFSDDFISVMNIKQESEGAHSPVCFIKQEPEGHSPRCLGTSNNLSVNTQLLNSPDRSQQGSPGISPYHHRLSPQAQSGLVNGPLSPLSRQQVSPQQVRHHVKQEVVAASLQQLQQQQHQQQQQQQQQVLHQVTHDSILREALTRGASAYRSQSSANTSSPTYSPHVSRSPLGIVTSVGNNGVINLGLSMSPNLSPHHQTLPSGRMDVINENFPDNRVIGHMGCGGTGMPLDIDVELMCGLDYDMDQVIKQELSLEGNLDFNFESGPPTSVGQSLVR